MLMPSLLSIQSLSYHLQNKKLQRPSYHLVWKWPGGVSLATAIERQRKKLCWCGLPVSGRRWYTCSDEHNRIYKQQFEFWVDVINRVMKRDNYKCQICGLNAYRDGGAGAIDHKTPIADGGQHVEYG